MSFSTNLIRLLKTDPRFVDDEGELVLAAVQDAAWKMDRQRLNLSEMDDAQFRVSEEDRALNRAFYGEQP